MPQRSDEDTQAPSEEKEPIDYSKLEERPGPNTRQQDKIIASVVRKNPLILREEVVSVTQVEREKFLEDWKSNHEPKRIKSLLDRVIPGYFSLFDDSNNIDQTKLAELWDTIEGYGNASQIKGIITVLSSKEYLDNEEVVQEIFDKREKLVPSDILPFLLLYSNCAKLDEKATSFMLSIQADNTTAKRDQYEKSLVVLMNLLYGKQFEYMMQTRYLALQAQRFEPKINEPKVKVENEIALSQDWSVARLSEKDVETLANSFISVINDDRIPVYYVTEKQATVLSLDLTPEAKGKDIDLILKDIAARISTGSQEKPSPKELVQILLTMFQPNVFSNFEGTSSEKAFAVKNIITRFLIDARRDGSAYFEALL